MKTRFLVLLTIAGVVIAAADLPTATFGQGRARKRPGAAVTNRPGPWNKAVLELFAKDARTRLGPGEPGPPKQVETDSGQGDTPGDAETGRAGFKWSSVVSAEALEDEIKAQLEPVQEGLKSAGGFKGGRNKAVGRAFGVTAAVFAVISQYDDQVRWKADARALAGLFGRAGVNSSKVTSDEAFKEARLRHADLQELVKGGKVNARAEEGDSWSDTVPRPIVMGRLNAAYEDRIKGWTASPAEFSAHDKELVHEAQILAMLARFIQDESYADSDGDDYKRYTHEVQARAQELAEAARSKNHTQAQQSAAAIYKACDACHGLYKGG